MLRLKEKRIQKQLKRRKEPKISQKVKDLATKLVALQQLPKNRPESAINKNRQESASNKNRQESASNKNRPESASVDLRIVPRVTR